MEWAAWKTVSQDRNNSELQDNMQNQGLTAEHIEAMKDANMGGEAIVNALLANSETFEAKTEFSQVTRPGSCLICLISQAESFFLPRRHPASLSCLSGNAESMSEAFATLAGEVCEAQDR